QPQCTRRAGVRGAEARWTVERPAPFRGVGDVAPLGGGAWRGPRPYVSGAAALRRQSPAPSASTDGGTYTRRYHNREHVNEVGRARLPAGVVPAAVCHGLTCGL